MIGSKPACWRWKPPADLGAVLLAETTRREWLEGYRGEWRLKKYGHQIAEEAQWQLLRRWHKMRCAICGVRVRYNNELDTDHDHKTELIRGFLCRSCNTLEGTGRQGAFALYRERPPAVICGVHMEYVDPWGGAKVKGWAPWPPTPPPSPDALP